MSKELNGKVWGHFGAGFSDSELAAEFWCSSWRVESHETSREVKEKSVERLDILTRFVILDHANEHGYE